MAKKCNTDPGEAWVSIISGSLDGAFTVTKEDAAGNFEGIHSGDKIRGECSGTHMTYLRPATNPRFEYKGKFNASKDGIKGKRKALSKQKRGVTDEEEWEGVKTPTLVNKKVPKRLRS